MKLTATRLRQIIKEEVARAARPQKLREGHFGLPNIHTLGDLRDWLEVEPDLTLEMMADECGRSGGFTVDMDPDKIEDIVTIVQGHGFTLLGLKSELDQLLDVLPRDTPVMYSTARAEAGAGRREVERWQYDPEAS